MITRVLHTVDIYPFLPRLFENILKLLQTQVVIHRQHLLQQPLSLLRYEITLQLRQITLYLIHLLLNIEILH